jgi:two-component system NtrC family response regulator
LNVASRLSGESKNSNDERKSRQETTMLNNQNLVGNSAALARVLRFITKAARTKSRVLIEGQSGTGKELVARALHVN